MAVELRFDRADYEYDIFGLIRAFFPGLDLHIRVPGDQADGSRAGNAADGWFGMHYGSQKASFSWELPNGTGEKLGMADRFGSADAPIDDWNDRWKTKNQLKSLVYRTLREQTGKSLPWGGLTGIRPVKLARRALETGSTPEAAAREMREQFFVSEKKAALAAEIAQRELELTSGLNLADGYSLYIGIPFCPSICLYCSFGSHPLDAWRGEVDAYLDALRSELVFLAKAMRGQSLTAVYVGGGTPTAIAPEQLSRLLGALREEFDFSGVREFTVEAGRPDTVTAEHLQRMREQGVTRISINPQTMRQETLDLIGRDHTVEQTREAFALARQMRFDNINMDMIIGLPGEGEASVRESLEQIGQMAPDSLTVHSLALKRAARLSLFRDRYAESAFTNSEQIMECAAEAAGRLAMRPYYLYRQKDMAGNFENVGYARAGYEGLYNVLIMEELQTIVGAGSGAATKFVYSRGEATGRVDNVKNIRDYIDRIDEMLERKRIGLEAYFRNKQRDGTK